MAYGSCTFPDTLSCSICHQSYHTGPVLSLVASGESWGLQIRFSRGVWAGEASPEIKEMSVRRSVTLVLTTLQPPCLVNKPKEAHCAPFGYPLCSPCIALDHTYHATFYELCE